MSNEKKYHDAAKTLLKQLDLTLYKETITFEVLKPIVRGYRNMYLYPPSIHDLNIITRLVLKYYKRTLIQTQVNDTQVNDTQVNES